MINESAYSGDPEQPDPRGQRDDGPRILLVVDHLRVDLGWWSFAEWVLDDPAGRDIEAVRPIRDEIERRVVKLLGELAVPVRADLG